MLSRTTSPPPPPYHTLSSNSKYYTKACSGFKVTKEHVYWTAWLFPEREIHHTVAQDDRGNRDEQQPLKIRSLKSWCSTVPMQNSSRWNHLSTRKTATESFRQECVLSPRPQQKLEYSFLTGMLHATFHPTQLPKTNKLVWGAVPWRSLLHKLLRVDWNKPVSYSSAWSDNTSSLYSLDDCYPGKQQKIA